ncbi:MAG: fumarylacetoacetate hydrolase [Culturomica sp.]|jgi:hypothetical protein|nr:fumarylacetoacetate hydrolase [Culturomica sp.]
MKLICAEYNSDDRMSPQVIGDNALLRNNNDFYYPDFTHELSCVPQVVLRACKLGKGVSERFASRYYDQIGVGVRFYADSLRKELFINGLGTGLASAFDDSAALSNLQPYRGEDLTYSLRLNETTVFENRISALPVGIHAFISRASYYFMIKVGDLFFCGNPFCYSKLKVGDRIRAYLAERCLLDFFIR